MKIVHCDTDDIQNPLRGGQPVRTYQINSRLSDRNKIKVFTATYPGSAKRVRRGEVEYETLGTGVPRFGLSHHLSFLALLGPAVRRTDHDIVVEEFTPPFGFCGLPLWTRKPVVSIVQWFFFKHWEHRYKLPFEKMMRRIPNFASYRHFIVQSRCMGRYFEAMIPAAKISLIPCGIADEEFSAIPSPGEYALFIGRLDTEQKGLDTLMDVWAGLIAGGHRVPLRIVGAGPAADFLKKRIRDAGLSDLVSLVGRVEGAQKLQLLQGARFLVMPSREETFGLTALEAMGASKPVIAFDIDNLNEVVRPGWGKLADDAADFARSVLDFWTHPIHCMELGRQAHTAALDYSWDRLARTQEQVYKSAIDGWSPA